MRPIGRLRWKMLALMLVGTIVIYVDRNVLGVLAPILKKELYFTTAQYSYVVSAVPARLFLLAAGRGLSDRSDRTASGLRRRRGDLGRCRRAARLGDRMDVDGGLPRAARPQRSGRDPDRDEDVDHLVPLAGALDRHRLVQLRLLDRFDDYAPRRGLALFGLRLAACVLDHRRRSASRSGSSGSGSIATPKRIRACRRRSAPTFIPAANRRWGQSLRSRRSCRRRNSSASSSPAS